MGLYLGDKKEKRKLIFMAVVSAVLFLLMVGDRIKRDHMHRYRYRKREQQIAKKVKENIKPSIKIKKDTSGVDELMRTAGRADPFEKYDVKGERSKQKPVINKARKVQGLVLTGITIDPGGTPVAIINNKIVREGDTVSGAQVVKIEDKRVILDRDGKEFSIYLGWKFDPQQ